MQRSQACKDICISLRGKTCFILSELVFTRINLMINSFLCCCCCFVFFADLHSIPFMSISAEQNQYGFAASSSVARRPFPSHKTTNSGKFFHISKNQSSIMFKTSLQKERNIYIFFFGEIPQKLGPGRGLSIIIFAFVALYINWN